MRCRRIKETIIGNKRQRDIVWFGSYGKNPDGTAKFFNANNKHDNFSENREGTVDSLIQRLSVIRRELWYNVSYGLPLCEDDRSKLLLDAAVSSIIMRHPDVQNITQFSSKVENHHYHCDISILSRFGVIDIII